ncbi:MAG: hypothetical protein NW217_00995 [Hyphomicrobiaceae bacterium]|nr:hypothetical protein [Hyphomicrobiaceae bacterium]
MRSHHERGLWTGLALAAVLVHAFAIVWHGAMVVRLAVEPAASLALHWCLPAGIAPSSDGSDPRPDNTGQPCPVCALAASGASTPSGATAVPAPVHAIAPASTGRLVSATVRRFELKPGKSRGPPQFS